jgi:hypothetical protein
MATKAKKLAQYSELQDFLSKELPINAARIKFIVLLMTALIKVQSVNFERLSQGFGNAVELSSNLRRIQRFFASFSLERDLIARLLFKLLPITGPHKLSLDRTNWKFGKRNINILVLSVIYKGLSLPILWTFLGDKRGNSDQKERIALLERYACLFGLQTIECLTADREFVGDAWWAWLIEHQIPFFIRMRDNMRVNIPHKGEVKAFWLFNNLPLNTALQFPKIVQVKGNWVYLSGMKYLNQKGNIEFLIVASYDKPQQALEFYKLRWQIETMFRAFKTAGFHLEDTHLKEYERLDKLLAIVALAFVWAYKVGIYRDKEIKSIKIKKHGRPEKSLFAYGLEWLAQVLINQFKKEYKKVISPFLSCT